MFRPRVEEAKIRGKPSHDSWLELRFIVPIEPSSVPESGMLLHKIFAEGVQDQASHVQV